MSATDAAVLQDDELLIERIFNAPPELVFRVWTTPEHLMRWWGPTDFQTISYEMDFRPGGAYRSCIRAPSGTDSWMSGIYQEIDTPRRIVMTFAWEPDRILGFENIVTVTFAPTAGGRTLFRFHQAPFASVEARNAHLGGWNSLLDGLAAYLATEHVQ